MLRVTHNMLKRDSVYNLNTHQKRMDELSNQLSTGKKVRLPHENPVAATHSMLYRTRITEIRQFIKNIDEGQNRMNIAEGAMRSMVDIFHRVEELTVQGAHGIYAKNDRAKIAVEIDELLKEMVQIANTKLTSGESLFAGFQTDGVPFEKLTSRPVFADREVITQVKYHGDVGKQNREIEQGEYAPVNLAGNSVFWATNTSVKGGINVAGYTAPANSKIRIDGKEIQINQGDNIQAIADKLNNAKLPLVAEIRNEQMNNPADQRLVIRYTTPREIWMEDIEGGSLLQDLGLKDQGQMPNELSLNAMKMSKSIFDVMILS